MRSCVGSHPCLHYQINEAWFHASDDQAATSGSGSGSGVGSGVGSAPTAATAAPTQVQAKTASGGDARWSYIVDAAQGYLLDGSFVATHPNSSVAEYTATYTRGVRENASDCLGFDARCRRAAKLERHRLVAADERGAA